MWKTNKNGEVSVRLTALWLSVARLHLKRGRLEKKKKAELNLADRGCDNFRKKSLTDSPFRKLRWFIESFRCELRLLIALNGYLTSPQSPRLNHSRCNERAAEAAGEASADSLLISLCASLHSRSQVNISPILSENVVTLQLFCYRSLTVLTEHD